MHWRELDGEWVVRAEPSGSLFQLDALSAGLLALIEEDPRDEQRLLTAMAEAMGLPADAALGARVRSTLDRLVVDDLLADPKRP